MFEYTRSGTKNHEDKQTKATTAYLVRVAASLVPQSHTSFNQTKF